MGFFYRDWNPSVFSSNLQLFNFTWAIHGQRTKCTELNNWSLLLFHWIWTFLDFFPRFSTNFRDVITFNLIIYVITFQVVTIVFENTVMIFEKCASHAIQWFACKLHGKINFTKKLKRPRNSSEHFAIRSLCQGWETILMSIWTKFTLISTRESFHPSFIQWFNAIVLEFIFIYK